MTSPGLRPLSQARLVLASASPRRSALLGQLGLAAIVDPSGVDETVAPHLTPAELVESLAHEKASDVATRHGDADIVLGADTVVVLDGRVLGKPADRDEAIATLEALSDHWHQVYTGYALIAPKEGRVVTGHQVSDVRIRTLGRAEIEAYVDSGEPMDKAGSYAIQGLGVLLVAEIRGCYTNIVGLPLPALDGAWRELGWSVL